MIVGKYKFGTKENYSKSTQPIYKAECFFSDWKYILQYCTQGSYCLIYEEFFTKALMILK